VRLDARLSEWYMLRGASGHDEMVAAVRRVVGQTNVFETKAEKAFATGHAMRGSERVSHTRCSSSVTGLRPPA